MADGVSFDFEFPSWFVNLWIGMVSVQGTIPSLGSAQESLECIVEPSYPRHSADIYRHV